MYLQKPKSHKMTMAVAGFMVRIFFVIAIALGAVILGMTIGLKAVGGWKIVPKHKIINVQASAERSAEAQTIKGG